MTSHDFCQRISRKTAKGNVWAKFHIPTGCGRCINIGFRKYRISHRENLKRFAEIHGLPQPSPLRGRDGQPPIYLPASFTYKHVHELYTESCGQFVRAVKLSSFCAIWHQCFPHIQFMTPPTDVCDRCEKHRLQVKDAVTEEKTAALAAFTAHLVNAKMERDKYKQCTEDAKKELQEADQQSAPPYAPCSNDLRKSHYTFDFAQQVLLPHTARQVGPIHF